MPLVLSDPVEETLESIVLSKNSLPFFFGLSRDYGIALAFVDQHFRRLAPAKTFKCIEQFILCARSVITPSWFLMQTWMEPRAKSRPKQAHKNVKLGWGFDLGLKIGVR